MSDDMQAEAKFKARVVDFIEESQRRRGGGDSGGMPVRQECEFTDVGAAQRFVKMFGEVVRYVEAADEWRFFYSEQDGGGRWVRDDIGEVDRMLKQMAQSIMDEKEPTAWPKGQNAPEFWKELRAFYERIVGATRGNRFASIKRLVKSELPIPARPTEFDDNIWLLNLKNGTYDLDKEEFRPAAREDLITKQANVAYDPDFILHYDPNCERCQSITPDENINERHYSVWLRGLYRYFNNDEELVQFVQRMLGYALTGATSERVIFILQGKRDAGKSTILRMMHQLLGDYATRVPMDALMQARNSDGERPTPMLVRLRGMRFVSALESDESNKLAEGKVKELVGGDKLIARGLNSSPIEFDASHKLFLGTNYMPRVSDPIVWAKIRRIKFSHSIPKDEQVPKEQLEASLNAEMPGIFNWLLIGYRAWREHGVGTCAAIEEATTAAQLEQDDLGAFLEDERWEHSGMVAKNVLLNQFNAWAANELGWKHDISAKKLGMMMQARDFVEVNPIPYLNGKKTRAWLGLTLKDGHQPLSGQDAAQERFQSNYKVNDDLFKSDGEGEE